MPTAATAHGHDPQEDYNQENAGKPSTTENGDADFAYHLHRVLSKFEMVISAESAELLAGLLNDSGQPGSG